MSDIQVTLNSSNITVQFPVSMVGAGVPSGGTAGQLIVKDTSTDYDTSWTTIAAILGALPEYNSNDAAIAAGVTAYRAGAAHDAASKGTIIYITS